MGSGKSYNCLTLIAKQEVLFNEPFYETVALCSTSGEFDKTVKVFKEAIKKSKLIAIKDTDLLTWLEEYMGKVMLYNTLTKFVNDGLTILMKICRILLMITICIILRELLNSFLRS